MGKKAGVNIPIGANLKKFSTDMQNVKRELRRTAKQMKSIGTSMTRSLTLPLVGVGFIAAKISAEFEQSMAKVKAISGATAQEFKVLSDNALELGRTTRYTASQVAELQLNLSKLGFKPKEIKDATAAFLDLALATGEDLATSANTGAATIKGFALEAEESGRVADVMAKSFSSSALDLEKFSTAMAVVAPVANKAGVSLEETTAILGTLTDRGVDASSAGAALRNIYLDLADKGISWADAMKMMQQSQNPLSTAMELFGKRGAAVASIIADNVDSISNLTNSLVHSGGAAKDMAAIMDNTLQGAIYRMKSALEGVAIEIGTALTPIIRALADKVAELAEWFKGLSETTKKAIIIIAALAAAAGPVLIILGQLNLIVAASIPLLTKLGISATGLLGSIGLVVGAFAGLVILMKKLNKHLHENHPLTQKTRVLTDGLKDSKERLKHAIQEVTAASSTWSKRSAESRAELLESTRQTIKDTAAKIQNALAIRQQMKAELERRKAQMMSATRGFAGEGREGIAVEQSGVTVITKNIESLNKEIRDSMMLMHSLDRDLANLGKTTKPVSIGTFDPSSDSGGNTPRTFDVLSVSAKKYADQLKLVTSATMVAQQATADMDATTYASMLSYEQRMAQFADNMKNAMVNLKQGLQQLAVETFEGLFVAIGQAASGVEGAFKDFGKNVLSSVAEFMGQFGKLLIAGAIASEAMQKALFTNPAIALAAGIGLVAVAGLIKGLSKQNPTTYGGGSSGYSPTSTYAAGGVGSQGSVLTLDTVVYGQDILLSSNRASNTVQRTRRK